MGIRLEVTTHPQYTVEELGLQLVDAMQAETNWRRDADSYTNQMQVEGRKIAELEFLIRQVKDFHKNPPEKISRMDPMNTYDIEALEAQVQQAKEARLKWSEMITTANSQITLCKETIAKVQGELAERRKK